MGSATLKRYLEQVTTRILLPTTCFHGNGTSNFSRGIVVTEDLSPFTHRIGLSLLVFPKKNHCPKTNTRPLNMGCLEDFPLRWQLFRGDLSVSGRATAMAPFFKMPIPQKKESTFLYMLPKFHIHPEHDDVQFGNLFLIPKDPCMVYLPTFGWFLW